MATPAPLLNRLRQGQRKLSDQIETRLRQARPGSVLILVVALLVLLALMGTAYISTAQIDRQSSAQNTFNTEIDLLIDGVCKIEQQQILAAKGAPTDGFDQSSSAGATDAMLWTSPQADTANANVVSNWLASRIPVLNAGNGPAWPYLSVPPLGVTFESPFVPIGQSAPFTYATNTNLQPTSITVQTASGSTIYPALFDGTRVYLAGSATNSGIADAGLFRLPIGELNGITYYGCAYTIDNSSAVNASIAYQSNSPNAALPGDFSPVSLDLKGMLQQGKSTVSQQLADLNFYRWGNTPTANLAAYYDDGTSLGYQFNSPLEAMWMQLGRRLDNPGINTPGSPGVYYQTLPIGESMAMAYRHCLMNPAASPSLLETYLAPSVTFTGTGTPIRTSPYSADQVQQWFNDNFIYDNGGGNIRPLLVSRNQVSNISGTRFTWRTNTLTPQNNAWDSTIAYKYGDWVTGYAGRSYVCIQDGAGGTQPNPNDAATRTHWAEEPWVDYPVKTSINTGTFGQLWLAYWSVMSASAPDQPDAASAVGMFRNPIRGSVSATASSSNGNTSPGSGNTLTVNPSGGDDTANVQGIINSSAPGDTIAFSAGTFTITRTLTLLPNRLYSGGGAVSGIASLTPSETLRLRAAIAAINSQQLRGNNSQILSRQIVMGGSLTAAVPTNTGGATLAWAGGNPTNSQIAQCIGGTSTEITGLTITGCQISLQSGSFNVHDNTFTNGTLGIFVAGDTNSQYVNNTFTNLNGGGIFGYPGSGNTYSNNIMDNCDEGIHLLANCDKTDISGNVITHLGRCGIELQEAMTNLTVNNNYIGLWMNWGIEFDISCATGNGNNITLSGNTLLRNSDNGTSYIGNGAGIEISGNNVTIKNNICYGFNSLLCDGCQGPSIAQGNTQYGGTVKWTWDGFSGQVAVNDQDGPILPLTALNPIPGPPAASGATGSATTQPSPASISYRVMLYGTGQQPYITEVYANNDQNTNGGFVAVSIYNPYSTPIALTNWQFATVNRAKGVAQLVVTALDPANPSLASGIGTLAPYQRVVFASKQPADMPTGITVDPGATFVYLPKLTGAFNNELVLVRPRDVLAGTLRSTATYDPATQTYSNVSDPTNVYDETNNLADFVPVDSYDFSGLSAQAAADDGDSAEWHYVRPSDKATHNWYFVYPNTYDSNTADNTVAPPQSSNPAEPIPTSRLFATVVKSGLTPTATPLGAAATDTGNPAYPAATKGFPIQINNTDFGGPKANASQFPFGGFARNGDILQTTFIGAYRIDLITTNTNGVTSTKTVEYQPVTMDAAFADDRNDNDNQAENVGRFCPLSPADCGNLFNDFDAGGTASAYHFATRLYDFLAVSGPADDYMQNVRASDNLVPNAIANVRPSVKNAYSNPSMPTTEDAAPIDGLININTAPWRVLATLPLANNSADNIALAKAIVQYRDVDNGLAGHKPHGPFKSIFELNGVPNFRTTLYSTALNGFIPNRLVSGTGLDNGPRDGDLAPFDGSGDQVPGDFEKQFLAFNRISNLVTVRSDSFTTYVLVQGWRNAGTATPELVVQRRAAFISDRSGSVPSNKVLNITNLPVH